jgi:PmbA protein
MLKDILDVLKNSDADDWEVTDTETDGWEFYFIRHNLDQNRAKKVAHINVTVYKKIEDKYLGRASAEIAPTLPKDEVKKMVDDLVFRASLVKNEMYTLGGPSKAEVLPKEEGSVSSVSRDFINTMNALPETKTEDINSYEIFVNGETKHFITSKGIDTESKGISSMIEVVVNARNAEKEIELYRLYNSGTCDTEGLKRDLTKTLHYGKDRLQTVSTPKMGKTAVVFSTEDACRIYEYFSEQINAELIYRHMTDWKLNEPIHKDIKGDRVTLKSSCYLKNSSCNTAYDSEGSAIHDRILIEQDVPQCYWGNRMFSQYLGLEDSFQLTNITVEGGTKTEEEIRSGRYLEIVEFSDFQVDSVTGDVFGEIRLGYLHDNGSTTIVTGGSVSGSMKDYAADMYMSKNQVQYNRELIPSLTRLENMTVTGISEK